MSDAFSSHGHSLDSPAYEGFAVVTSDSTDFDKTTRAIYVGVSGDIAVVMESGDVLTFIGVPQGTVLPVRAKRVNTTNTGASFMIGLL